MFALNAEKENVILISVCLSFISNLQTLIFTLMEKVWKLLIS